MEPLDTVVALLNRLSHRALALTCKTINTSATAALYATCTNREAPSDAPFDLFLRTLCERPDFDLAVMVRGLDIRGWRSEFEVATGATWQGMTKLREQDKVRANRAGPLFVSTTRPKTTTLKLLKLFEQIATQVGLLPDHDTSSIPALQKTVILASTLEKREDFARLLRRGFEDAQVVLMLALLPNLAKLQIDGMSAYPTLDWHYLLRTSDTALRALLGLEIHGHVPRHNGPIYTTNLRFLEFVPKLEHSHLSNAITETLRPSHRTHVAQETIDFHCNRSSGGSPDTSKHRIWVEAKELPL